MRHILVLAPEAEAASLRALIELDDLTVSATSSTEAALSMLHAPGCDLVVLAAPLPHDDGSRFCRELHRICPRVPLLLLTPMASQIEIGYLLSWGVDWFLRRPYRAEDVLRSIRSLLAGRVSDEVVVAGQTFPIRLASRQSRSLLASAFLELLRCQRTPLTAPADLKAAASRPQGDLYRQFLQHAHDPIFLLNHDGVFLEANSRAEQLLARPAAQIIGHSFEEFVPAMQREHQRARVLQVFRTGSQRLCNFPLECSDGQTVTVDISASVVEVGGGEVIVAIAHQPGPGASVGEQYQQSQKMEAIGRLAGGVAHDFNNLLTIINGYGEILLTSMGSDDPARRLVQEIAAAGDRAATLTRQLLAFSSKRILEPRILDLNQLVRDLSKMLVRLIGERITLRTELEKPLAMVKADPGKLEQVIMNLVVNARDAMEEGGELTIRTGNIALDQHFHRDHPTVQPGWYVFLTVQDTGCGMTEATRARVFEPFFTTKAPGKGTGLGLATVLGIVEQSGGHIQVESQPGQGTTFSIYLPASDEAMSPKNGAPAVPHHTPRGTETILVVEDENSVRAMTRHVLRMQGYCVLSATDGLEAEQLCAARSQSIDLLVTDVIMPHMGGPQLAQRMLARHPGLKVLYLSGYPDDSLECQPLPGINVGFLRKPFAPSVLAEKVREVLGREIERESTSTTRTTESTQRGIQGVQIPPGGNP